MNAAREKPRHFGTISPHISSTRHYLNACIAGFYAYCTELHTAVATLPAESSVSPTPTIVKTPTLSPSETRSMVTTTTRITSPASYNTTALTTEAADSLSSSIQTFPAMESQDLSSGTSRKIIVGVVTGFIIISTVLGVLIWLFLRKLRRVKKKFDSILLSSFSEEELRAPERAHRGSVKQNTDSYMTVEKKPMAYGGALRYLDDGWHDVSAANRRPNYAWSTLYDDSNWHYLPSLPWKTNAGPDKVRD